MSSNGDVVSVGGDKVLRVWDLRMMRQRVALAGHQLRAWGVACGTRATDGGIVVASCSSDRTVRLWNLGCDNAGSNEAGMQDYLERTSTVLGEHDDGVLCVDLARDASVCVSGCEDGKVYIWKLSKSGSISDLGIAPRSDAHLKDSSISTSASATLSVQDSDVARSLEREQRFAQVKTLENEVATLRAKLTESERRHNNEILKLRSELNEAKAVAQRERNLAAVVSRQMQVKEEEARKSHMRAIDAEMQCAELRATLERMTSHDASAVTQRGSVRSSPFAGTPIGVHAAYDHDSELQSVSSHSGLASRMNSQDPLSGWIFSAGARRSPQPQSSPQPRASPLPQSSLKNDMSDLSSADGVHMRGGAVPLYVLDASLGAANVPAATASPSPLPHHNNAWRDDVRDSERKPEMSLERLVAPRSMLTDSPPPAAAPPLSSPKPAPSGDAGAQKMSERLKQLSSRLESLTARTDRLTDPR